MINNGLQPECTLIPQRKATHFCYLKSRNGLYHQKQTLLDDISRKNYLGLFLTMLCLL
ncbi:hypothetical protein SEE_04737 [Salmonella enterica subsp. enterica serovar Typhimurium str. TN061786]|nr:hypothetical protein SEE_04737 [Salmonella enterica subsp. enterica serovar Typhimurium str. TN061786]